MMKTAIIGHTHLKFKEIPSTNKYAMEYISNNSPIEGTVISAEYQTAGQGQIGRNWYAEPGKNVLCSIILRPTFIHPQDQFSFNQAMALAIRSAISQHVNQKVLIKWPNDIYVKDQKIAGILIQNIINSSTISYSVVGVGVNVNQMKFPDYIPNPVSLCHFNDSLLDLPEVSQNILSEIETFYGLIKEKKIAVIQEMYLKYLLGLNQSLHFENSQESFIGKIMGVDQQGRLLVEKGEETKTYLMGDIKFLDFQ